MKKTAASLSLCLIFLLLLFFPAQIKNGASEGLYLWYKNVVPILFPFIILSNYMVTYDSFAWLIKPFLFLHKLWPKCNPWYFYALILGFFCGYPMGAKAIVDLLYSNKITSKEASLLLPIANQASPMFVAGYLGIFILENQIPSKTLFSFIYLPPAILFLFYLIFRKTKKQNNHPTHFTHNAQSTAYGQKNSMSQSLEHTIWNSFSIIVTIGVYMMAFTIVMHLIKTTFPNNQILSVLACLLEFSSGLNRLKDLSFLAANVRISLCIALTSFGGICTMAQSFSILQNEKLSPAKYVIQKVFIALIVFCFAYASLSSS